MDGILLEKWGIRTIKNGNLYLLSKSLYTKTIFCFTWCSTLSFTPLGYMFLNYIRNSLSPFIAQSLSMNFETP